MGLIRSIKAPKARETKNSLPPHEEPQQLWGGWSPHASSLLLVQRGHEPIIVLVRLVIAQVRQNGESSEKGLILALVPENLKLRNKGAPRLSMGIHKKGRYVSTWETRLNQN